RPDPAAALNVVALSDGQQVAGAALKLHSAANPVVGVVGTIAARPSGLDFVAIDPALLPDRLEGYTLLDALVLDGGQRSALTSAQLSAIEGWVGGGGYLVVTGGSGMEQLLAGLPESLRLATAQAADAPATSMA